MRSLILLVAAACTGSGKSPTAAPNDLDVDQAKLPLAAEAGVPADAAASIDAVMPDAVPPPTAATGGVDFIADAKLLFRIAACGGSDPLPEAFAAHAKIIASHCKKIGDQVARFRAAYFDRHQKWFRAVVPEDVPATVVYPFGGGDLVSAMVAFPNATEVTTISLELAGDPRRLRTLEPAALQRSLAAFRVEIGGLIQVGSNTSKNLSSGQRNDLPGQVSSFLLGIHAAGFEPVSMRYFTLDDGGAIRYLDQAALDAAAAQTRSLKGDWHSPNFSAAFSHVEIQYRRPGQEGATAVRTHRHFGWNLADPYLAQHPQLVRHLEQKGKVTLLVKGASYLLWSNTFSTIRTYLATHLAWMLSDSTGLPPHYARKAGFEQITYGNFAGAFLEGSQGTATDVAFVELWQKNPKRSLPFRFGYTDMLKQVHLVVTRPKQ
ncbi:MAG: hypothetical protein WKG01_28860 [Kofleriaceae bacterium]